MHEVATAPVREGDVLAGKYRVDRVLGAGGMGVVVAATHLQLDRRVALKFLVSNGTDGRANVRFLLEARASVKLRSEHVVRVLDTGSFDSGQPYIVMELLEGRDLQEEIAARGSIPMNEAVDWVLQACEGIAEAHAAGIVHRDLKPANLFLTRRADHSVLIKVLDFGIAKWLDVQRAPDYSLTKTSTLMGSPHYMSPEQIRNAKNVDRRADIWALGIVLYELLCGRAPFSATAAPALLAQIVADPPLPLKDALPDLPRALEAVIQRCLEKDPALRFASVHELARELAQFASEEGRASSERVARISLAPRFPHTPSPARTLESGVEPALGASDLPKLKKTSALGLLLPLGLGLTALLGVLGYSLWPHHAAPSAAVSAIPSEPMSPQSNVQTRVRAAMAPELRTEPEVTPSLASSLPELAQPTSSSLATPDATAPHLRMRPNLRDIVARSANRGERQLATPRSLEPTAAPAEAAPDPLDERK